MHKDPFANTSLNFNFIKLIFKLMNYPLNMVFFMGMRPDLAIVGFIVLPACLCLMGIPFVFAIRNYLSSSQLGVKKHRSAYEHTPLSRFMCNGPPGDDGEPLDEDYDQEEDLASTFDGDYSGKEEEEDELLISDNESVDYYRVDPMKSNF